MNRDLLCFVIMAGSAAAALFFFSGAWKRKAASAGLAAGFLVSLLNMAVEFTADRLGFYHVRGPAMILATPLPLSISWLFLGFLYCLAYEFYLRRRGKASATTAYVMVCALLGFLADVFLFQKAGILKLGQNGSLSGIAIIWFSFLPLTLFFYELFREIFSHEPDEGGRRR